MPNTPRRLFLVPGTAAGVEDFDSLVDALEAVDDLLDFTDALEATWEHNDRLRAAEDARFGAELEAEHQASVDASMGRLEARRAVLLPSCSFAPSPPAAPRGTPLLFRRRPVQPTGSKSSTSVTAARSTGNDSPCIAATVDV